MKLLIQQLKDSLLTMTVAFTIVFGLEFSNLIKSEGVPVTIHLVLVIPLGILIWFVSRRAVTSYKHD